MRGSGPELSVTPEEGLAVIHFPSPNPNPSPSPNPNEERPLPDAPDAPLDAPSIFALWRFASEHWQQAHLTRTRTPNP